MLRNDHEVRHTSMHLSDLICCGLIFGCIFNCRTSEVKKLETWTLKCGVAVEIVQISTEIVQNIYYSKHSSLVGCNEAFGQFSQIEISGSWYLLTKVYHSVCLWDFAYSKVFCLFLKHGKTLIERRKSFCICKWFRSQWTTYLLMYHSKNIDNPSSFSSFCYYAKNLTSVLQSFTGP